MKTLAGTLLILSILSQSGFAAEKETYSFPNGRKPGQIDKVTCKFEKSGELLHFSGGKEHAVKVNEINELNYDEKTLAVASSLPETTRSARFYEQAEQKIKHGDESDAIKLSPDHRLIGAVIDDQAATIYSPLGPLKQEELVLIDILGNSLLLDGLLPETPVAVGDHWKHSEKFVKQLLWLDKIETCNIHSKLDKATDDVARFTLTGKVAGVFRGVESSVDLDAVYHYDRHRNRIKWFGVRIKEQRKSSPHTDGAKITARSAIEIVPQEANESLSDAALKTVKFDPLPELLQIEHASKNDQWAIASDRCWELSDFRTDRPTLQFLENGEILAQCMVSAKPKTDPGKLITLEGYQSALQSELKDNFGEFVEAGESETSNGYRLLRVVIRGNAAKDLPMRWIYYHVADPEGRQAVFVFVVEEKHYERLAPKDKKLVLAFRFTEKK
jgi:hypothetical protein